MRSPDSRRPTPNAEFQRLIRALREEASSLDQLLRRMREQRIAYVQARPSSLTESSDALAVDAQRVALLGEHRNSARLAVVSRLRLPESTTLRQLESALGSTDAAELRSLCRLLETKARSVKVEQRLAERLLTMAQASSEAMCLQILGLNPAEEPAGPAIYDRNATTKGPGRKPPYGGPPGGGHLVRGTL